MKENDKPKQSRRPNTLRVRTKGEEKNNLKKAFLASPGQTGFFQLLFGSGISFQTRVHPRAGSAHGEPKPPSRKSKYTKKKDGYTTKHCYGDECAIFLTVFFVLCPFYTSIFFLFRTREKK